MLNPPDSLSLPLRELWYSAWRQGFTDPLLSLCPYRERENPLRHAWMEGFKSRGHDNPYGHFADEDSDYFHAAFSTGRFTSFLFERVLDGYSEQSFARLSDVVGFLMGRAERLRLDSSLSSKLEPNNPKVGISENETEKT